MLSWLLLDFFHHVFALYCIKENGLNPGVHALIEKDHLGEWIPEKDWLDWSTVVLLRTPINQMIFFNQGIILH